MNQPALLIPVDRDPCARRWSFSADPALPYARPDVGSRDRWAKRIDFLDLDRRGWPRSRAIDTDGIAAAAIVVLTGAARLVLAFRKIGVINRRYSRRERAKSARAPRFWHSCGTERVDSSLVDPPRRALQIIPPSLLRSSDSAYRNVGGRGPREWPSV